MGLGFSSKKELELENLMIEFRELNKKLTSSVARLLADNEELHGDLRTLHPLSYPRLHLKKCLDRQKLCNDAEESFVELHTLVVINADSSLSLQLDELKNASNSSKIAHSSAVFLCEPPPTLEKVLWIIAEKGHIKEVVKCMNLNKATRSCKMLQRVTREVKGKYGLTQLNYSAWMGMTSSVNRMLSMKGIEVESRDNFGNTPLIVASASGNVEIVEILLKHGAKIEGRNNSDASPLYIACQNGQLLVVDFLLYKGANLEAKTIKGWTSLHTACRQGHYPVVSILINKGAKLDASTISGGMPLHMAASFGHLMIVKALIAKGANTGSTTNDFKTVLATARQYNQSVIVSYLESIGLVDDGAGRLPPATKFSTADDKKTFSWRS